MGGLPLFILRSGQSIQREGRAASCLKPLFWGTCLFTAELISVTVREALEADMGSIESLDSRYMVMLFFLQI